MGWKRFGEKVGRGALAVGTMGGSEVIRAAQKHKEGEDGKPTIADNYATGMSSGIAQGRGLLADPNLASSRKGLKEALNRTSSSQDDINQKASRAVANQRYQGNTQSSALQKKEMTRAVCSDLSKDA